MFVGSGNTTNHPNRKQILQQIYSDYTKIRKKPAWLTELYLKVKAGNLSWNEIRRFASLCRAQLQIEKFGREV
jgi:hypothetical protein